MAYKSVLQSTLDNLASKIEFYQERSNIPDADITALKNFSNGTTLGGLSSFVVDKIKALGDTLELMKQQAPDKITEIQAIINDIND